MDLTEPNPALVDKLRALRQKDGGMFLDLGCGLGRYLQQAGASQRVFGLFGPKIYMNAIGSFSMKITLNLSKHCIKCAAIKAHEARLYACFKAAPEKQTEILDQLEALRVFLETTDFPEIRSRYPVLAGEIDKDVILEVSEEGGYKLAFDGMKIQAPTKISLSQREPATTPMGPLRILS